MIKWIIVPMNIGKNVRNSSNTFVKSTGSKQHIIEVFDDTTLLTY